jgi:CO/xanthine dehydrogenase Mo-binding subunit
MELTRGDVEKGFADAEIVVEGEFRTPMVHQGYIEPHACVARHGADGRVVVWCPTQGPFLVRDACAGILHLDAATIRVIPSEIGGASAARSCISNRGDRAVAQVRTTRRLSAGGDFRATDRRRAVGSPRSLAPCETASRAARA